MKSRLDITIPVNGESWLDEGTTDVIQGIMRSDVLARMGIFGRAHSRLPFPDGIRVGVSWTYNPWWDHRRP